MADAPVPYGRKTQPALAFKEIHILWITAGLSCDGDTISMTAATQPSLEDLLMGGVPGIPRVHLHNPVLAYEVGDEFMHYWYQAEEGRLDPLVLAQLHQGIAQQGASLAESLKRCSARKRSHHGIHEKHETKAAEQNGDWIGCGLERSFGSLASLFSCFSCIPW